MVDDRGSVVMLVIPLEAGLLYFGVRSTYIRGLQIENSILSRLPAAALCEGGTLRGLD